MVKVNINTQCKLCGHIFSNKYNLKRHLEENLCKEMSKLNLYEVYLRFSSNDKITVSQEIQTQTKTKSVSIQTEIEIEKSKARTITTQTNLEDIDINKKLYPIEKVKYDYIKFNDVKHYIEKYKYDTKFIYISQILQLVFCHLSYEENHVIKYTKSYPPTFVFLSNKLQNEENINDNHNNESKYLNIGKYGVLIEYFYPHIKKMLIEIYKNIVKDCKNNHNWSEWYDYNEDQIKEFTKDLKNEKTLKDAIKYFLKNILINHKMLKYKI